MSYPSKTSTAQWLLLGFSVVVAIGASGCTARYARVIAQSSPQATVSDRTTGESFGQTPAYIDVRQKVFFLKAAKRSYTYTFEHQGCGSIQKSILVTRWTKNKSEGPQAVTTIAATLPSCCVCATK